MVPINGFTRFIQGGDVIMSNAAGALVQPRYRSVRTTRGAPAALFYFKKNYVFYTPDFRASRSHSHPLIRRFRSTHVDADDVCIHQHMLSEKFLT